MKKIILLLLVLILTVCGLGACNNGSNNPPSPPVDDVLYLEYESVTINISQKFQLRLKGGSTDAEWESSNTDVVSVSTDGEILGKSKGKAVITATKNGKDYICNVVVTSSGNVPLICLDVIDNDVNLTVGATYTLLPYLTYDLQRYSDAEFTFESSNDAFVTVDTNGCVEAIATGEAIIRISAVWRDNSEIEPLNVKVIVA